MVRTALGVIMIANTALFLFGAIQHVGIPVGRFHEPRIIPAAVVESICGSFLALIGNLVALGGVLLGMAALAAGRGPRTASNDLYHRFMLVLIVASLLILFFAKSPLQRN